MGLRLTIGFFLSIILWFAIVSVTHTPRDRFLPPSASFNDLSKTTTGYITETAESPWVDHWWEGSSDVEWYLEYKFQPSTIISLPGGAEKLVPPADWQTGRVSITRPEYENKAATAPGTPVEVTYDPYNPLINGLTGTGKINLKASWMSGWLVYVLGFIATTIAIGEIMKKWIVPPR
ncbi:MAG: hypothetical protein P4L33_10070 [Capsulimonadaceae bacterium]|nr:hypothetical protein [Capsulimonadaceae bacterium]